VPGAGSGPGFFRGWPALLPDWVELQTVAAPGREHRIGEPGVRRLTDHVEGIASALAGLAPLPLALFGHSMGALVAWELAHHLRATGGPSPSLLFISAMRAPHVPRSWPPLSGLADDALLSALRARFGGFPAELDRYPELKQMSLDTARHDLAALEAYHPPTRPPLEVPIRLLGGRDDGAAPPTSMRPWTHETTGRTTMRIFAGGHDYLATHPGPAAAWVTEELARIRDAPPIVP
jgi:medium-chain acyl-[acyl-carrier-protein] hydrolase